MNLRTSPALGEILNKKAEAERGQAKQALMNLFIEQMRQGIEAEESLDRSLPTIEARDKAKAIMQEMTRPPIGQKEMKQYEVPATKEEIDTMNRISDPYLEYKLKLMRGE